MSKLLDRSSQQAMGKVIQSIKNDKSVEKHQANIRLLFFGKIKNVKLDPRFSEKMQCLRNFKNDGCENSNTKTELLGIINYWQDL